MLPLENRFNVTIDLTKKDNDTCGLQEIEELIHQKELFHITNLLKDSLEKAKTKTKSEGFTSFVRRHDTITLSGSRGSGKTTFILTLFNFIKERKLDEYGKYPFSNEIEIIELLDPTLIEEKGHIFLNIIARIKEKIDNKLIGRNAFHCKEEDAELDKYRSWEGTLKKLAEGLPCIDGIGPNGLLQSDWHDSDYVMERGIKSIDAANHLEKYFHEYVEKSLAILEKKAFLLCFDDVDTNFSKGQAVLETISKYLTTPGIITVLSGDLTLYSYLVRKIQWENFGYILLDTECKLGGEYRQYEDTITRLEEQFFLKILKPERRIYLNTLYQKDESGKYNINIKIDKCDPKSGGDDTLCLSNFYKEKLSLFGIKDSRQERYFWQFLANLPFRTQIQLMTALARLPEDLHLTIINLFWNDLAEKKIDVTTLRDHPEVLVIILLEYLKDNNIFSEGYTFRPVFGDMITNGAQFAAGVLLALNIVNKHSLIFHYWLRIGLTRDINLLIQRAFKDGGEEKEKGPSLDDYIEHCALLSRKRLSYTSRTIVSYLRGLYGSNRRKFFSSSRPNSSYDEKTWIGTIPLYGLDEKQKSHDEKGRIDKILKQLNKPLLKYIGYLPLSIVTDYKGNDQPVYSIFNLIAFIGELVENLENLSRASEYRQNGIILIKGIIFKNAQLRHFPLPSWASSSGMKYPDKDENEDENDYDSMSKKEIEILDILARELFEWWEQRPNKSTHPYLMAKISTRFFYTLNRIDSCFRSNFLNKWVHRMIVAFLNSILVEEYLENIGNNDGVISLTNPVTTDQFFSYNLKKLICQKKNGEKEPDEKLFLSKWLICCPIWKFFMNLEDKDLIFALNSFCDRDFPSLFNVKYGSSSVYEATGQVQIFGNSETTNNLPAKEEFSSKNKEHIDYLLTICRENNLSVAVIKGMAPKEFYYKIHSLMSKKFNIRYAAINAIHKRIINGKLV